MPFLTPHIYKQAPDEPWANLPQGPSTKTACRQIIHIINLFAAPAGSEWAKVQRLTTQSMLAAKAHAEHTGGPKVTLVAVTEKKDAAAIPPGFEPAPWLTRTAQDVAAFQKPRPLPLLFDILDNGLSDNALADDTAVIYTNADICLQEHFYATLPTLMAAGYDCLSIYRRTVPKFDLALEDLAKGAAHPGQDHGGHDCFVFPAPLYKSFVKTETIIGIPLVARSLLYNMVALSEGMAVLPHAQLTFHFGDDQEWASGAFDDYLAHNRTANRDTLTGLIKACPEGAQKLGPFLHHNNEAFRLVTGVRGAPRPLNVKKKLNRLMYRTLLRPWQIR